MVELERRLWPDLMGGPSATRTRPDLMGGAYPARARTDLMGGPEWGARLPGH